MIAVTRNWDGEHYCLSIRGHAEDAPAGESLVCAAVSILYFSIYRSLKRSGAAFRIDECERGWVRVYAEATAEMFERLRSAEEGFVLLAQHYPESLRLTMREPWEMRNSPR